MNLEAVPIGTNPPHDVNVVIEVPIGGEPIKYEMDKASGALMVDRFLYTSMRYPGNYGFIPHTLSGDGDPCDVIVANTRAIAPGAIMSCRIVGVLLMEDEAGGDEKLIARARRRQLTQRYDDVTNYTDLPGDHGQADRALLHALQGPGARQMGQDHPLGRRRRGPRHGAGGDRTRESGRPRRPINAGEAASGLPRRTQRLRGGGGADDAGVVAVGRPADTKADRSRTPGAGRHRFLEPVIRRLGYVID